MHKLAYILECPNDLTYIQAGEQTGPIELLAAADSACNNNVITLPEDNSIDTSSKTERHTNRWTV